MADENTIKLEDFLKFTGIEPKEGLTQDELHNTFRERYILKEKAHEDEGIRKQAAGRRLGVLETEFKKLARDFGVEFGQDMAESPLEDLMNHTFTTIKQSHEGKLKEIQSSFDPEKKDAVIKDWEKKYNSLDKTFNEHKKLFDTRIKEFEKHKSETESEMKSFKINTHYNSALSKGQFKEGVSDFEKKGFDTHMKDNYKFDFDEQGSLWAYNKKTGERVPHPEKMDAFMNVEEVINMEIKNNNLGPKNDKAETKKPLGSSVVTTTPNQNEATRKVHSNALVR